MEDVNRWYFTKDQLADTPSRKSDIGEPKELSYRQQAANFIQDMGQCLQVSQLCINTAIAYMHRFYVFHSFKDINRNSLSMSALFLAAKVEEQPRKLEHVIKVANVCLKKEAPFDVRSEAYAKKAFEVVALENILLQTLGFVLAIEHPHTYVVKVCQLVKASKDLAQTSYLMATTSLHMTTMCLQYKPTIVACVCIHLACKWSSYKIEPCTEGKEWFYYVDRSVTWELLETLTQEFIAILETSPHRFKPKASLKTPDSSYNTRNMLNDCSQEKNLLSEGKIGIAKKTHSASPRPSLSFDFCHDFEAKKPPKSPEKKPLETLISHVSSTAEPRTPPLPTSSSSQPSNTSTPTQLPSQKQAKPEPSSISLAAYRVKRERALEEAKIREEELYRNPPARPTAASNHQSAQRRNIPKPPEPPPVMPAAPVQIPAKEKHRPSAVFDSLPPVHNKVNNQVHKPNVDIHHKPPSNYKAPIHAPKDAFVMLERVSIKQEIEANPEAKSRVIPNEQEPFKRKHHESPPPVANDLHQYQPKPKHPKLHINSSIHNSQHGAPQLQSNSFPPMAPSPVPVQKAIVKEVKTNGSKDVEATHKRVVENSVKAEKKSDAPSKHHKHKSKHSSKEKNNHSSEVPIKVKIRKDIINLSGVVPKSESPKPIKIKLPKPPAVPEPVQNASPSLKLVITKNKSGSGSYTTSHKEGRKRSIDVSDAKSVSEAAYKTSRMERRKMAFNELNSKPVDMKRNDIAYQNADFASYPHLAPPPRPPKSLTRMSMEHNTNSNPPMPPPLPSELQPPLPPPPPPGGL